MLKHLDLATNLGRSCLAERAVPGVFSNAACPADEDEMEGEEIEEGMEDGDGAVIYSPSLPSARPMLQALPLIGPKSYQPLAAIEAFVCFELLSSLDCVYDAAGAGWLP